LQLIWQAFANQKSPYSKTATFLFPSALQCKAPRAGVFLFYQSAGTFLSNLLLFLFYRVEEDLCNHYTILFKSAQGAGF